MNPAWKEAQGVVVFEGFGNTLTMPNLSLEPNGVIWVRRGSHEHQAIILFEKRLEKAEAELALLKSKLKQAEELNSKINLDE